VGVAIVVNQAATRPGWLVLVHRRPIAPAAAFRCTSRVARRAIQANEK